MKLGNLEVKKAGTGANRLAALFWGFPRSGKTTLACTGPGEKLLINLDPEGTSTIAQRKDVHVVDLSSLSNDDVMKKMESDNNPLGLDAFLKEHPKIQTVVFDSMTAFSHRALETAVARKIGASTQPGRQFVPTMETPGISAYGGRNAITLRAVRGLLRVTGRYDRHLIVTAHEDDPTMREDGTIEYITLMLGGKMVNNMNIYLSEVWHISDLSGGSAKQRRIAVRPTRMRKPMKTRIFDDMEGPEFTYTLTDDALAKWWGQWVKNGGKRIPLPSTQKGASNNVRKVSTARA